MNRKWLSVIGLILAGTTVYASCGTSAGEDAAGSSAAASSASAQVASSEGTDGGQDSVVGEYLSEAGDGEILRLNGDGTFVSYTVTDMSSTAGPVALTETVTGNYTETQAGECALTISEWTVRVEGAGDDPEMIEVYVDLMAGDDEEQRALYTRLFGGEEITGRELYGEDVFASIAARGATVRFDFLNSTFAYLSTAP